MPFCFYGPVRTMSKSRSPGGDSGDVDDPTIETVGCLGHQAIRLPARFVWRVGRL